MLAIYGKMEGQKQYKAINYKDGTQVDNLMYASLFQIEKLEQLKEIVNNLNEGNKEWNFQVRKFNKQGKAIPVS